MHDDSKSLPKTTEPDGSPVAVPPTTEAPKPYTAKTGEELEKLAWEVMGGQVFWSAVHGDGGDPFMSFPIVTFFMADEKSRTWVKDNQIATCYEHMSKAGPLSINGMPSFLSLNWLDQNDSKRLLTRVIELDQLKQQRMATERKDREGV